MDYGIELWITWVRGLAAELAALVSEAGIWASSLSSHLSQSPHPPEKGMDGGRPETSDAQASGNAEKKSSSAPVNTHYCHHL
jgi:hypothetical protein